MSKKINYAALYTLRKDGRYMGYWHDAAGTRHAVYDRDPARLHAKIAALENPAPTVPTFAEVADRWEVEHVEPLSRGTQKTYKAPLDALRTALGQTPITEISAAHVNRLLLAEKASGYSYKHAALLKSLLKQIMDYAVVQQLILYNPCASVTVPRGMARGHVEAPETDVLQTIQANLDKPFGAFVAVLLYTGLRTEEAAALTWADIGPEEITIRAAVDLHGTPMIKPTKTAAGERSVPILSQLRPFLQKPPGAKPSDYVFHDGGKLLTRGQITSRWLNWCKSAGLAEQRTYTDRHRAGVPCTRTEWRPLLHPHQLRHNYATVLYEQGVDLLTAKDVMGHKDIETTRKIYTSLRKEHREAEIKKIEQGF